MAPSTGLLARITTLGTVLPADVSESVCAVLEASVEVDDRTVERVLSAVTQSSTRENIESMLRLWQMESPGTPSSALAWALRASSATDEWHRLRQRLELVWSGPAPLGTTLRRTDQALLELIRSARRSLIVVTFAAYRVPEIRQALLQASSRGVTITFVAENPEVSQGKVSFDPVAAMGPELAQRSTVYVWPLDKRPRDEKGRHGTLHAKAAIADEERLLISSANLTGHAMILNIELGLLVEGGTLPAEIAGHLRALVAAGDLSLLGS